MMPQSSTMDTHARSAGTSRYEIVRLVSIDSYVEGRILELPLAGGTTLTGRNGRGKTSLLQLIPAFYGERPDRIGWIGWILGYVPYYAIMATSDGIAQPIQEAGTLRLDWRGY